MQSFFNENLLPIVEKVLNGLKKEGCVVFYTTDVIKSHMGHYIKDSCPPSSSINANYGMFLKEHMDILGITEIKTKVNVVDDQGGQTSSSEWKFV